MDHLTPASVRAALSGDAALRRCLEEHLREPCEVCERFLANTPGPGLLDGVRAGHVQRVPVREVEAPTGVDDARAEQLCELDEQAERPAIAARVARHQQRPLGCDESRREVLMTWRGLRMQTERPVVDGVKRPNRCLADFVAPKGVKPDYVGLFAVTAGAPAVIS